MAYSKGAERRRGLRIESKFWIRVKGLEDEATLHSGNISVSGLYFETDEYHGEPGTVEQLEIGSEDGTQSLETMACVVRLVTVNDLWHEGSRLGVAFYFLPLADSNRQAIRSLVSHVAKERLRNDQNLCEEIGLGAALNVEQGPARQGMVRTVQRGGLIIETDWPVDQGAEVGVTIEVGTESEGMRISGVVESIQALAEQLGQIRYRVHVSLHDPSEPQPQATESPTSAEHAPDTAASSSFTTLLDNILAPVRDNPAMTQAPHIAGDLSRVSVVSLLSLIEHEQMSGSLHIDHAGQPAVVYASKGQVVDAEFSQSDETPEQVIESLVGWTEGRFRFRAEPVSRPKQFKMTTTGLLLEAIRKLDEAAGK